MATRTVACIKLGKELPGLEKPPFPGELGRRIFDSVSAEAWEMWKELQLRILNEYRLSMADAHDHQMMVEQMMEYLNLKTTTKDGSSEQS